MLNNSLKPRNPKPIDNDSDSDDNPKNNKKPHVDIFPPKNGDQSPAELAVRNYQNLVTSILYSMYNPTIPFPRGFDENLDGMNDEDDSEEDDPNTPVYPSYESPVATLKLKEASKKDFNTREKLITYQLETTSNSAKKLESSIEENSGSTVTFVSVDISLPAAELARRERRRQQKIREEADRKLEEAKEKRMHGKKYKRELVRTQKDDEIKEETRQRREKIANREANMKPRERKKLERVREELRSPNKFRKSGDCSQTSPRCNYNRNYGQNDDNDFDDDDDGRSSATSRKVRNFKDVQKQQKQKFLATKAMSPKENNEEALRKILNGKSLKDRNSWINGV
ncbi:hypothetical protein TRFO_33897 [Tritrichomonas foetus]|uniref:Uncharacterized protein n=1 Tax=Tritrichomonas foetus TaxID=1144522 RepID=A0A1J4JKE5_9EUKA|nr:hypothetical protein TRFO_33897 [Tritrichomonas foetus]|eukprot:OHS99606.1 hypothetical protein TRFO_33897 [Tritrichomonas foetus]